MIIELSRNKVPFPITSMNADALDKYKNLHMYIYTHTVWLTYLPAFCFPFGSSYFDSYNIGVSVISCMWDTFVTRVPDTTASHSMNVRGGKFYWLIVKILPKKLILDTVYDIVTNLILKEDNLTKNGRNIFKVSFRRWVHWFNWHTHI